MVADIAIREHVGEGIECVADRRDLFVAQLLPLITKNTPALFDTQHGEEGEEIVLSPWPTFR